MRQNIGLVFLTAGSIVLAMGVFHLYLKRFYQLDWEKFPWEVRLFCKLIGINNKHDYFNKLFMGGREYFLPSDRIKLADRIKADLPIIALLLMVIGMLLCFDYFELWRLF